MEIVYRITAINELCAVQYHEDVQLRWLDATGDYEIFLAHLRERNPQAQFGLERWSKLAEDGITYCGLFKGGVMIARAAVERYSRDAWETADVQVFTAERGKGYAKQICHYVTEYILRSGKHATCRTESDNMPMQNVILALGFVKCDMEK